MRGQVGLGLTDLLGFERFNAFKGESPWQGPCPENQDSFPANGDQPPLNVLTEQVPLSKVAIDRDVDSWAAGR